MSDSVTINIDANEPANSTSSSSIPFRPVGRYSPDKYTPAQWVDHIRACYPINVYPKLKLVRGKNTVKKMLPAADLPAQLNPFRVDFEHPDCQDIPLVWFGVPFHRDRVFDWALRRGWGAKESPEDEKFDMLCTWRNIVIKFNERYKMHIRTLDVFGAPEGKLLLTFYSNRQMATFTTRHRDNALKVFKKMGYAEDEPMWYLDIREDSSGTDTCLRPQL
ncbi:hypothetical protein L226DRAFT_616462 [Lentinus tigrinus ALCF2SS1-7]|uniref:Uncharacterized protein n=1 Tax=Lentinus tigrinus ALCF2SS1-6 TaxID=1328759 RepID=A0A5C2RSF7_9APHY|nr:hypothetical protein L227DRAFT_616037 [Lentinus tigrinus ALCF2SS1-6]RPD70063.1 hypothetical protein L226DRAFT_616462 [Lentinus tigrinus ALCF2SS1-7]